MLDLTDAASAQLADILDRQETPQGTAVRLVLEGGGIAMTLDGERQGDATFEHEGRTVLLLDEQLSQLLDGRTLDLEPSPEGAKLTLRDNTSP